MITKIANRFALKAGLGMAGLTGLMGGVGAATLTSTLSPEQQRELAEFHGEDPEKSMALKSGLRGGVGAALGSLPGFLLGMRGMTKGSAGKVTAGNLLGGLGGAAGALIGAGKYSPRGYAYMRDEKNPVTREMLDNSNLPEHVRRQLALEYDLDEE